MSLQRAGSCTSELQLKVNCRPKVNCRIKFGLARPTVGAGPGQPKKFPTIHFQSTIHIQLKFTCTWSRYPALKVRKTLGPTSTKLGRAWFYMVVRLRIVVLLSTFSEFWYYAFRFMNIKIRIFIVLKSVQSACACNPGRHSRKFLSI